MNELDALTNEAAAVDAEAAALNAPRDQSPEGTAAGGVASAPGPDGPAPVVDPVQEAKGLVDTAVAIAVPFCPALEKIYDEAARDRLARAAAPLMAKYGVSVGGIFAKWKEEIDFAFVALPLALATIQAVKAQQAAKKTAANAAEGGGPVHTEEEEPSPIPSLAPLAPAA